MVATVHVERESIQKINISGRQLVLLTDEELLVADPSELIASKAIITIDVRNFNDGFRPTIAINVSPEGEEIALGSTVDICTNFTILSADRRLSTYKRHQDRSQPRLTTHALMQQVDEMLQYTEQSLDADLEEINVLKSQQVSRKQWHELSGELFTQIHFVNRQRLARNIATLSPEEKALPITAAVLANIVAEAKQPSHEEYAWDGDLTNRWNLINFGTEMIKLDNGVPSHNWLETSANWSQIIKNRIRS